MADDPPAAGGAHTPDDELMDFLRAQKGKTQIGGMDLRTIMLIVGLTGGGTLAGTGLTAMFGVASAEDLTALTVKHEDLVKQTADRQTQYQVDLRAQVKESSAIERRLDAIELRAEFTVELLKVVYPKAASRLPTPPPITTPDP